MKGKTPVGYAGREERMVGRQRSSAICLECRVLARKRVCDTKNFATDQLPPLAAYQHRPSFYIFFPFLSTTGWKRFYCWHCIHTCSSNKVVVRSGCYKQCCSSRPKDKRWPIFHNTSTSTSTKHVQSCKFPFFSIYYILYLCILFICAYTVRKISCCTAHSINFPSAVSIWRGWHCTRALVMLTNDFFFTHCVGTNK